MKEENQGLTFGWRKGTKVYRLDEEIKPRFTGGMEKKDQGLKVKNENQGWIKKGNQGLCRL